ncbi:ThiF family adenylyltransferase [Cohnella sp. CFH 77786]|uniref:ThiF family adenylyltransferase n=1 Tax=Cohnella sp. CFH 77786 TaxID=2662265 RepID=UPI002108442D|nr:ThiF family adenylyltransferase [Cohnella sp. CFH 77786]
MLDDVSREERYSRQIRFAPIGAEGQRRLGVGAVLIAGTGALGASLAQHMVRAGVGTVRLVDRDYVEPSNLQRQALFDEEDARAALPKAVAAAGKLTRINGGIRIEAHVADIGIHNVDGLLEGIDLVLDGTDNAETRLTLSDACYDRGIPLVYGGVAGSEGMTAALVPGATACLRCLIGGDNAETDGDRTCDAVGVISPAVEMIAALQAAEALKWLSGRRSLMRRSWIGMDVWSFSVRESRLPEPRAGCPVCGAAGAAAERGSPAGKQPGSAAIVGAGASAGEGAGWRAVADGSLRMGMESGPGDGERSGAGMDAGETKHGMEREAGASAVLLCGRDTVQVTLAVPVPLAEARSRLAGSDGELLADNAYLLKWSVPGGERIVLFSDGRALVQGTADEERAIRLCQEYLQERREPAWAE